MHSQLTGPDLSRDPQPADNLILWLPVFLCGGIGSYFLLRHEPSSMFVWGLFAAALVLTAATLRLRDFPVWRWLVSAIVVGTLGLALAQHQTQSVPTKLLYRNLWSGTISGTIDSFERAGAGWRVSLQNAVINNSKQKYHLRLTIRMKNFTPEMGGKLTVQGSLLAPSPSMVPGSFDFRRHAFFDGISGYGYATKIIAYQPPSKRTEQNRLENYRDWLTEKVYKILDQPEAGIVTAMLNGQRAGIARKTTETLQKSGLQHVISISGLHVGLMAMTIFFVVRFLLACSMRIALHWPIKKIAAGAALLGIVFYLLIVGNTPPTLRSVLMSGAALIAIMLDREPIQMRVVALSALAILLLQPDSLIDIGFQMSFAAVIGLVAFYQQTKDFWSHARWQDSIVMKALRMLLITAVTSLIATVITAPLVLLYFQQIPMLSMLANLLATPPITFLIMPGTFLAYLATPFPVLGDLAIRMMGLGVTMMMWVADFVAALPSAVWQTPPLPMVSVPVILLGFYILVSVKNKWRLAGVVPIVLGLAVTPFFARPDLYLTQNRLVLYPQGSVLYAEGRVQKFDRTILLQWTGTKEVQPFDCQNEICDLTIKGKIVRLVRTVPALTRACEGKADLILTRYYLDQPCKGMVVLDRHDLDRRGGQAVWLGKKLRIETVLQGNARRLWQ